MGAALLCSLIKMIIFRLFSFIQEERSRGEHNLTNISKTHERMQQEQKSESFFVARAVTGLFQPLLILVLLNPAFPSFFF